MKIPYNNCPRNKIKRTVKDLSAKKKCSNINQINTPVVELSGVLAPGLQVLAYYSLAVAHMPLKTTNIRRGL